MLYVATAQAATAQLGAIKCTFDRQEHVVINKLSRLSVYQVERDGTLELTEEIPIWSGVSAIATLQLSAKSDSSIIVLTTCLRLFVLEYRRPRPPSSSSSRSTSRFETVSSVSIAEPFARVSEYQTIQVDPDKRCLVVHVYDGLVRVVPIRSPSSSSSSSSAKRPRRSSSSSVKKLDDDGDKEVDDDGTDKVIDLESSFNVRISNLNVTCLALVSTSTSLATLAIVFADHLGKKRLSTYSIDLETRDLEQQQQGRGRGRRGGGHLVDLDLDRDDPGSEICFALRERRDGVVVVGERLVRYYHFGPSPSQDDDDEDNDNDNLGQRGGGDAKGKRKAKALSQATSRENEQGIVVVEASLPLARITCHGFIARDRFLLGDLFGKLFLVDVRSCPTSGTVRSLDVTDLGDTTSPTSIVPLDLDDGSRTIVYLSSRFGDAQLVKLPSLAKPIRTRDDDDDTDHAMSEDNDGQEEEEDLELVASYPNVAPVLDACIVGGENGSAGFVVTCSGAYKSGSLRVIRRGVGFTEDATIEVEGVQRLWSLADDQGSRYLVLGYFQETRIVRVSSSKGDDDVIDFQVEDVELLPFRTDIATVLATRVGTHLFVQVTQDAIEWTNSFSLLSHHDRWTPPPRPSSSRRVDENKITCAAAAGNHLLVGLQSGDIVVLVEDSVTGNLSQLNVSKTFESEIASIDVHETRGGAVIAAVALWTSSRQVHLLSVPDLEVRATSNVSTTSTTTTTTTATTTTTSDYLVRSVALTTFRDGVTTLFAALGDGSLVTVELELDRDGNVVCSDSDSDDSSVKSNASLKRVVLGNRPFLLSKFEGGGGGPNVFAAGGDRPTVISRSKDRLVFSSVNLEEVMAVAPISVPSESNVTTTTFAIVSRGVVRLGRMNAVQQVDVRTIPLDEDEPRRIAHDAQQRAFAILCSRRDVDRSTGQRSNRSSVRFLADDTFSTRSTIEFGPNEEGQAITRFDSTTTTTTMFAVATAFVDPDVTEDPDRGRLVLYRVSSSDSDDDVASSRGGEFVQVTSIQVNGCPFAIVDVGNGHVALAVNSQVVVYSFDPERNSLSLTATWSGAFIALALARGPDDSTLVVGDALRSVTLLRYTAAGTKGGPKLEQVARDYRSRYMVAVESIDPPSSSSSKPDATRDETETIAREFIGAESDLNLFTVQYDPSTEQSSGRLEDAGSLVPRGSFHLGEMVSKFRHGVFGQQYGGGGDSRGGGGVRAAAAEPKLVFTTSAGSIGIVADLDNETSNVLSSLERNMRSFMTGVGNLSQEEFRSFKIEKRQTRSTGFVDGTFVEQFLDLSSELQDEIVQGRNEFERLHVKDKSELIKVLEEVARLH
ncbi:hypothetical protein JCM3766R1_006484 [Sporobolomyces carnicolor]